MPTNPRFDLQGRVAAVTAAARARAKPAASTRWHYKPLMFLSSAASDFITGQTINFDGGKSMHEQGPQQGRENSPKIKEFHDAFDRYPHRPQQFTGRAGI